jgi:hypothetical protein
MRPSPMFAVAEPERQREQPGAEADPEGEEHLAPPRVIAAERVSQAGAGRGEVVPRATGRAVTLLPTARSCV